VGTATGTEPEDAASLLSAPARENGVAPGRFCPPTLCPGVVCPDAIVAPMEPLPLLLLFVVFADALLPTGTAVFGATVTTGTTTGVGTCAVGDAVVTGEVEVVSNFFFCASVIAFDADPFAALIPVAAVASAMAAAVWTGEAVCIEVAAWIGVAVWACGPA